MGLQTRTANVDLDAWLAQVNGAGNYGNGAGTRIAVGYNPGIDGDWTQRFAIRIPLGSPTTAGSLFEGIPSSGRISSFRVYLRCQGSCGGQGSAVRFFLEKATGTFTETSYNSTCGLSTNGGASGRWPGPARETTNRGSFTGTPASGDWIYVDLTAMAQAAYNAGETELRLVAVGANAGLTDYDELTGSRRFQAYSRESTSKPYGQLQWNDNQAPSAPIDQSPADGSYVASTTGNQAAVSSRHIDPEGDPATKYQAQWFPAGTTDDQANAGTVAATKDDTVTATTAHNAIRTHTFTGLPTRTGGEWRMRFYDGQWGTWGPLTSAVTAYKPTAVSLAVQPGTVTPYLYASISSSDPGDFITAVDEYVYQDPAAGATITKLAAVAQAIGGSPTRSQFLYNGGPLSFGTQYRRQMRIYNRDGIPSDLTGNQFFTQSEPTGATIEIGTGGVPADNSTKIDTLTPTFRVRDPGGNNIDQARIHLRNEAGTVIYDPGTATFAAAAYHDFVIPAGILTAGANPSIDGAVRVSGNADIGPTSAPATLHVNATPGSPYPVIVTAPDSTVQVVQRPDGVWVSTSARPNIHFPFRDADRDLGYTEYPTLRDAEVRDIADALIARQVRVLYALDDHTEDLAGGELVAFDQPGSLAPTASGWVAGTACALSYDAAVVQLGIDSLKLAYTNLASAAVSTSTRDDTLHLAALYTDLSAVAQFSVYTRRSAGPAGLAMKLRFNFSGNAANFAEFNVTPTANNAWQQFVLTRTAPAATGGVINWAQVSGIRILTSHTAGSNQTFNLWIDDLRALVATLEATTKRRARYDDTAGSRSEYSDYIYLKYSAAPILSSVAPANGATITDPSPTFTWLLNQAQAAYRLVLREGDTIVYDSELVTAATLAADVAAFTLPNGTDLDYTLTAYNADGLWATATGTITTAFTQPAQITGLVLAPDPDAMTLEISWNASALPANEFEAYYVDVRLAGGQFRRLPPITVQSDTTLTFRGPAHNDETVIRVSQTNGWATSEPTEASAELDGAGYWLKGETTIIQLPRATTPMPGRSSHGPGDTNTRIESIRALDREDELLLTWETTGYEGRLAIKTQDRELIDQLRAWKEGGTTVIFATPYGAVRYVRLMTTPDTDDINGWIAGEITYKTINPDAASF